MLSKKDLIDLAKPTPDVGTHRLFCAIGRALFWAVGFGSSLKSPPQMAAATTDCPELGRVRPRSKETEKQDMTVVDMLLDL
jgi:hypothetical protein